MCVICSQSPITNDFVTGVIPQYSKQFSPNLGDGFYTFKFVNFTVVGNPPHCDYKIELCRGQKKWCLFKRYSHFYLFYEDIVHIILNSEDNIKSLVRDLVPVPPKTWRNSVDTVSLRTLYNTV